MEKSSTKKTTDKKKQPTDTKKQSTKKQSKSTNTKKKSVKSKKHSKPEYFYWLKYEKDEKKQMKGGSDTEHKIAIEIVGDFNKLEQKIIKNIKNIDKFDKLMILDLCKKIIKEVSVV